METPERHLLEGYAAEKARKGAEYQLGANQIVLGRFRQACTAPGDV
jgi:hypothetical protein